MHLVENYRNNENFRVHVKMLLSLSYIPLPDVIAAFEELSGNSPAKQDPIIDFWEDNYIGRLRRNRRGNSKFPLPIWNVYNRILEDLPRTNNSVEGWHRAFQQTIDCHYPSVYKLIDQFRKEQDRVEIDIQRFYAGIRNAKASKLNNIQLNQRLKILVQNYNSNNSVIDYLRGISNNLEL